MNSVVLTGQLVGHPHFHWVGSENRPQAFIAFLLRVRGPAKEGDSVARCVAYGKTAEATFQRLNRGTGDSDSPLWVEVHARYRIREGDDGKRHHEFVLRPHGLHCVTFEPEGAEAHS